MFTSRPACFAQMTNPLVYSSVENENLTKIPTSCRACFFHSVQGKVSCF
jgi:hypothetical protein